MHHSDEARVLEYGADEFAIKPIRTETVVDRFVSMLEQEKATDSKLVLMWID